MKEYFKTLKKVYEKIRGNGSLTKKVFGSIRKGTI